MFQMSSTQALQLFHIAGATYVNAQARNCLICDRYHYTGSKSHIEILKGPQS